MERESALSLPAEVTAQIVICKPTPCAQVEVTPYSLPPELPEVMKPPLEAEAAAQEMQLLQLVKS